MGLQGERSRYRGVRQAHAARGILIAAYLSALLWMGLGYTVKAVF